MKVSDLEKSAPIWVFELVAFSDALSRPGVVRIQKRLWIDAFFLMRSLGSCRNKVVVQSASKKSVPEVFCGSSARREIGVEDTAEQDENFAGDEAVGFAMVEELFDLFRSKADISSIELAKFEEGLAPLLAFIAKGAYAADCIDAFMCGEMDGKTLVDTPSPVFDGGARKALIELEGRYAITLARAAAAERRAKAILDEAALEYEEAVAKRERAEKFWGVLALMKVIRAMKSLAKEASVPKVEQAEVASAEPDKLAKILFSYPEGGMMVFKRIERERTRDMSAKIDEMITSEQGRIVLREAICQGLEMIDKNPDFRDYAINKADIEGL